jgi:putative flippase GtrA
MQPDWRRLWVRLTSREVLTFLGVGATGYVVDLVAFNLLLSAPGLAGHDPTIARVLSVAVAMVVTYVGNRLFTWRTEDSQHRAREVSLFVVFNLLGMGFSVATLFVSHDLLGLTSRLSDNVSANVVGVVLGTVFRYWAYKRFVFTAATTADVAASRDAVSLPLPTPVLDPARRAELVGGVRRAS